MLDRDKYNQDEYNDYYQQEIRNAETSEIEEEEPSKRGVVLLILGLAILAVAGYFGYKSFNNKESSETNETIIVKKEVEKPIQTTQIVEEKPTKIDKAIQPDEAKVVVEDIKEYIPNVKEEEKPKSKNDEVEKVTQKIEKEIGDEQKMSPEEIAKVVQMVMSQINSKKDREKKENNNSVSTIDTKLISELSDIDTDSVNDEDKKLEDALNSINEITKDTNIKNDDEAVDTYNKVKVLKNGGDDELSKLSNQISSLISDRPTIPAKDNPEEEKTYTQALKKEVVIRKNEMRIIIVRKGDTLGKIAKRAYGNVMEYKKIYRANPEILKRPDRIYIGQKLRIPK